MAPVGADTDLATLAAADAGAGAAAAGFGDVDRAGRAIDVKAAGVVEACRDDPYRGDDRDRDPTVALSVAVAVAVSGAVCRGRRLSA